MSQLKRKTYQKETGMHTAPERKGCMLLNGSQSVESEKKEGSPLQHLMEKEGGVDFQESSKKADRSRSIVKIRGEMPRNALAGQGFER